MIVSIHQPAYLPWLGYFHKIYLSDTFAFFDSTQFEKNSFINRNKIKTPHGEAWLTVPVSLRGYLGKKITEIEIANQIWQKKHWKSIELNYKKSKYWNEYSQQLKKIYENKYSYISDLCYDQLLLFLDLLSIKTKIIKSSELKLYNSKKENLILDICRDLKANLYISGSQGRDYINNDNFNKSGIKLYFQSYNHPVYEQLWSDFSPAMSIIDLLFNHGPRSHDIILSNNITKQQLSRNHKLYE